MCDFQCSKTKKVGLRSLFTQSAHLNHADREKAVHTQKNRYVAQQPPMWHSTIISCATIEIATNPISRAYNNCLYVCVLPKIIRPPYRREITFKVYLGRVIFIVLCVRLIKSITHIAQYAEVNTTDIWTHAVTTPRHNTTRSHDNRLCVCVCLAWVWCIVKSAHGRWVFLRDPNLVEITASIC